MRIDNNFMAIAATYLNRSPKTSEVKKIENKEKVVEPVSKSASNRKSGDSFERSTYSMYKLYDKKGRLI